MAPKILVYTCGFENAFLAEGVDCVNRLEASLNHEQRAEKNRLTLVGAHSFYREDGKFKPSDHREEASCEILNTNTIDFIYGVHSLIFNKENCITKNPISVLWGFRGLKHRVVGEFMVPGKDVPRFTGRESYKDKIQKQLETKDYLEKRIAVNFVPFYSPRADSKEARMELLSLINGLPVKLSKEGFGRILINNKKDSDSYTRHSIYLGESSKNYESSKPQVCEV